MDCLARNGKAGCWPHGLCLVSCQNSKTWNLEVVNLSGRIVIHRFIVVNTVLSQLIYTAQYGMFKAIGYWNFLFIFVAKGITLFFVFGWIRAGWGGANYFGLGLDLCQVMFRSRSGCRRSRLVMTSPKPAGSFAVTLAVPALCTVSVFRKNNTLFHLCQFIFLFKLKVEN